MGNWKLTRAQEPQALTDAVLREMRHGEVGGLTRRQLIRRTIGAAVGLWLLEVGAGTVGFLWPNLARGFGGQINLGDITTVDKSPALSGLTLADGAPAYFPQARTYVQLIDTSLGFQDGESADGSGSTTNVRTMWQKCPHLGCKPNFCDINYWFECACHGSRYDRLGTKVQELGPAPRGLDRFAHVVQNGQLIVDTSKITLGPAARGARPAGPHPRQVPGRVHMSDDRDSRALTPSEPQGPQPPDTALTPAPEGERRAVERFSAGPTAHTAGLTEERGAQIVRQSANARTFVALAILLIALFIPVYWFIESGVPALGTEGRMTADGRGPVRHRRLPRLRALPRQLRHLPRRQRPGRRRAAAQQPAQALQRHHGQRWVRHRPPQPRLHHQRADRRWPLRLR